MMQAVKNDFGITEEAYVTSCGSRSVCDIKDEVSVDAVFAAEIVRGFFRGIVGSEEEVRLSAVAVSRQKVIGQIPGNG